MPQKQSLTVLSDPHAVHDGVGSGLPLGVGYPTVMPLCRNTFGVLDVNEKPIHDRQSLRAAGFNPSRL
jgi:hypothetical protein